MKAVGWTTWERYMPSARSQTRTGTAGLCLKPWDQILPEEGIEERMSITEPFWRPWEKYLPDNEGAATHLGWDAAEEKQEKVRI